MKRLLIISICFFMCVALISCEDQTIEYGSVTVDIIDNNNSKTVVPSDEDISFSKYKIIGKHSDEEIDSIEKEFSEKSVKIDYLTIGEWKFYVEGYNKDGKLLAKSEPKEVLIETGKTSKTKYVLDWIKGNGKFNLSIKVQTSKVSNIECRLYKQDNDTDSVLYKVDKRELESDSGLYSFEESFDVPSGFYNSEIVMKNTDGLQIGVTLHPSVHIYNEFESYYDFSWEKLQSLLPIVDTPAPDIDENDHLYCNSTIHLRTDEDNTQIFYSFNDSNNFTKYSNSGISIPNDYEGTITLNVRAEKDNLTASEIKSFIYQIKHEATHKAKKDATCLESGNLEYWECNHCKKKFKEKTCETVLNSVETPALEHKEVKHEAKSATCEEIGWKAYVTCSRCEYSTYEEIKALGHSLEHHDAKDSTCTEIGYDAYEACKRCNYTTYVEKPKLGHDFIYHDAIDPTCVNDGCREYVTCSRCSYTTYEKIEALGHDEIRHDSQEASCTEKGWDAYITCKRCNYTTYNEIPAKGHSSEHLNRIEPTCTKNGNVEYWHCNTCNKDFGNKECDTELESIIVPALGHNLNKITEKEPTCTEAGYLAYEACSRCDYTTYEEKPALGHAEVKHDAKPATCEEIGWNAYVTCSRCEYSTYEEVEALGHSLEHHDEKKPTCTEIGHDAYETCLRCTYTTYVEKPKLGHNFINHDEVEPTCVSDGCKEYVTCSRCNYTTYEKVAALGHDEIRHDPKEATCTEKGWNAYVTCSRCEYNTYDEIKALGHSLEHHDAKEPTCTEIGHDAYETCSRCNYTTRTDIPAKGHSPVHYDATAATCTTKGNMEYWNCSTCKKNFIDSKCENESSSVYTPSLGHDYQNYRCTRCNILGYGPSGGRIIYDCDADNGLDGTETGPDGLKSSTCGWRFIEQTSQAISQSCVFGCKFVTGSAISSGAKETGIGFGKSNTEKLVTSMGDKAWIGGATYTDNYAAKLAYDYSTTNNGHTFSDWYLPSYEELKLINKYNCWSSTEYSSTKAYYHSPGMTDERLTTYKTVYGVRYFSEKEPFGHSYECEIINPATCTTPGTRKFSCPICGDEYEEDYSISHQFELNPGHIMYCNICNEIACGPAGGYIFYDVDEDNGSDGTEAGPDGLMSSKCNWKYLEAAPFDLGKNSSFEYGLGNGFNRKGFDFGVYSKDSGSTLLFSNGTTVYDESNCTNTSIGTGKENTSLLVSCMGSSYAFVYSERYDKYTKTTSYVAKVVNDLTYNGYSDWFVPSRDELVVLHRYSTTHSIGNIATGQSYWSSSESTTTSYACYAWVLNLSDGTIADKANREDSENIFVRPIRRVLNTEL